MRLLFKKRGSKQVDIHLPASKSINNRFLIINALFDEPLKLKNPSTADDSTILKKALESNEKKINVGMAGTAFRFLTAYFSIHEEERILTGDTRMKERPIAPLVDALGKLGAEIEYLGKEGFPPLKIRGKKLLGGKLEVQAGISSQFVSALLLIAPKMQDGLELKLMGNVVSSSYIEMTAEVLKSCGIKMEIQKNLIRVFPGNPAPKEIEVEADWSSAAFFYNFLCCTTDRNISIFFPSLKLNSIQGDAALHKIYSNLGINTMEVDAGVLISKKGKMGKKNEFNFMETPDLVQPFLISCAVMKKEVRIKGVANLRLKETDRIVAMQSELEKLGAKLLLEADDQIYLIPANALPSKVAINTYKDHRMAMSFAALAAVIPEVKIEDPDIVSKSFPAFWEEMEKIGIGKS